MSRAPLWRQVCRCAVSDGVPRRSFIVAIVVGIVLNLINQGDALIAGRRIDWVKVALTFAVPYFVATYGAVSYRLRTFAGEPSPKLGRGQRGSGAVHRASAASARSRPPAS